MSNRNKLIERKCQQAFTDIVVSTRLLAIAKKKRGKGSMAAVRNLEEKIDTLKEKYGELLFEWSKVLSRRRNDAVATAILRGIFKRGESK